MKNIKLDKKGQREIVLGVAIVVLVLILIVFAVMFNAYGDVLKAHIKKEFFDTTQNMNLLNYLRTPLSVDGKGQTVADVIAIYESKQQDDYYTALESKTAEVLGKLYTEKTFAVLVEGGKFRVGSRFASAEKKHKTCALIPATETSKTLEVCLLSDPISVNPFVRFASRTITEFPIEAAMSP
jgi:Na+-transporting methylmalonyl-CoA/oxaloacetate decarboxylase gamma subunit